MVQGDEAIAAAQALQQKIEEKATPIRLWLVRYLNLYYLCHSSQR